MQLHDNNNWFEETTKKTMKSFGFVAVVFAILNLALIAGFIGGTIYFVFWCLKHFGVI